MIGKVLRGQRVGGLLRYLFGPGRSNEHTDPHLVASWDGDPAALAPVLSPAGRHDVGPLTRLLEQPVLAATRTPDRPVWHCALRAAPTDRRLSDEEWRDVARDVVARTGLAPDGDDDACRWVAVRHANDHIHLVVTLARQDGHAARVDNDFYRVGEACRAAEERLGLARTPARDRTAPRRPTRAETEKAARASRPEPVRVTLTREVRTAAAGSTAAEEFLDRLRDAGLLVRTRTSIDDPLVVTGYAVALPADRSTDGATVWFGGGRLAADLSWTKLAGRWETAPADDASPHVSPSRRQDDTALDSREDDAPVDEPAREKDVARHGHDRPARQRLTGPARAAAWRDAAVVARDAAATVTRLAASGDDVALASASDVAHAAGRLLSASARVVEGRHCGPLTRAADAYDRAARDLHGRLPARQPVGDSVRAVARLVSLTGRARRDETAQVLALLANLAALADAVADLRRAQQRRAQADAAKAAATHLYAAVADRRAAAAVVHTPRQAAVIHRSASQARPPSASRRKVVP